MHSKVWPLVVCSVSSTNIKLASDTTALNQLCHRRLSLFVQVNLCPFPFFGGFGVILFVQNQAAVLSYHNFTLEL